MSKHKKTHKHESPPTLSQDRASNPLIPWLHGLAAMGDQRWEEAIVSLQRFLEMATESQDRRWAHQNLGACYLALEQYDDALASLDEAERYAPGDPDIVHSRGVTYACAGRILEAIAAFQEFARRWPKQARNLETREALRQLRRAQQGEIPADAYLIGHLQEQITHDVATGDWQVVERKARRMIRVDPKQPEGHFALGLACLEQDHPAEALEALQTAHACDPKYEPTICNIGHAYLKQDEPEKALPWLERSLRLEPKKLATLHELGGACEQLGRRDEAIEWWQRALKLDPSHYLAQLRLYEIGAGPKPSEPRLPPAHYQLQVMTPIVKARMHHPTIYRNGKLTLMYDGGVGFVLEDTENSRNATIHAGGPFQIADVLDEDLLDLIGLIKMVLRMINVENTRDVAVLAYYANRPVFHYQARFERGERVEFDHDGRFVVTEVPRFFKVRIDSDLVTPYGTPMQGMLIYLSQHPKPGILISTLGLGSK
jgi:tetratricopeptide (TPR) repeat protein